MNEVTLVCEDCYGDGELSSCCMEGMEDNRCMACGKFTKSDICGRCNGTGHIKYSIGDQVSIFVCVWSPYILQEKLYRPPIMMTVKGAEITSKTFYGRIEDIVDERHALVKIKYTQQLVTLPLEEMELI